MSDFQKTIEVAATATKTVRSHVDEAQRALSPFDGRVGNGYGIFSDPSMRRADLARRRLHSMPPGKR